MVWKFRLRRRARKAPFSRKNSRAPFLVLPPCYADPHREVDETIVYDSRFERDPLPVTRHYHDARTLVVVFDFSEQASRA